MRPKKATIETVADGCSRDCSQEPQLLGVIAGGGMLPKQRVAAVSEEAAASGHDRDTAGGAPHGDTYA